MRSMFKWLIAAVALVAFAGGTAMAEPSLSGYVASSFGQVTRPDGDLTEPGETSQAQFSKFEGDGRAELNWSGGTDSIEVKARMRLEEQGATTWRHAVKWNASPQVSLELSGRGYGIGGLGDPSYVTTLRPFFGDSSATIGDDNTGLLNAEFNAGVATIGVALIDQCLPNCHDGDIPAIPTATEGPELKGDQTTAVHAYGSQGPLGFNVALLNSSGSIEILDANGEADNQAVSGQGTHLGVSYDAGAAYIGFDFLSTSQAGISDLDEEDVSTTEFSLGVKAAGATLQYHSASTSNDGFVKDATSDSTNLVAQYLIDVGGGVVGPGLSQSETVTNSGADGADDITATSQAIYFGARADF